MAVDIPYRIYVLVPFIDRYKKFSWRDRPIITAFGITSIAQIMVTTYWGFYISPDVTIPLVERLVIDPMFFYSTMILLVPLGFGFTYMMIKLANEAERKSKLAKSKGPQKVATINLSEKWINWLLIALLAFQVFLNIAAYNAALTGMKNMSLFFVGIILLVFAAFFHVYRYALSEEKNAPPPPPVPVQEEKPKLAEPDASEPSKLPEGDTTPEEKPKELTQESSYTKDSTADLGVGADNNPNLGSDDLERIEKMSSPTSSHAYGIGVIALIIGMSVSIVFYTSFYVPESLAKPSVSEHILNPDGDFIIEIVPGSIIEGNENYVPNQSKVLLGISNKVIWKNLDDTPHTVTPDHRASDSYSGDFGSIGVIKSGESFEFLFTEAQEIPYHCEPHPWMTGNISIELSRF